MKAGVNTNKSVVSMLSFGMVFVASVVAGCSPLDNSSGALGNGAAGCVAAVTSTATSQTINSSKNFAQSFLVQNGPITVSNVQLNFILVTSGTTPLPPGSTITLSIFPDSNQTPGNIQANAPSGGAAATGTLDATTISSGSAAFYNFTFSSASLSSGVYWIVINANMTASATTYVQWNGASGSSLPGTQEAATLPPATPPVGATPTVISPATTFDMLVGC